MRIKLLHILASLKIGGAEGLVVDIIKHLDRKVFNTSLCCLYPPSETKLEDELRRMNINTFYLGKHRGFDVRMISRINRVLGELKPDIVHTHSYVMRYVLLPTILTKIPIRVHTVHNPARREVDSLGIVIHKVAYDFFHVVPVSISLSVARSVRALYRIVSPVIYNGIETSRFVGVNDLSKERKSRITFINVGSFRLQKNHRLLIKAFAEVIGIKNNIVLLLVGDGQLRLDMEQFVKERNLENSISFLGVRNDVPELLSRSDIYVSSSDWEGFGLSIVEAMAAGKPVVATAVDGVPELIDDGIHGLLVPSGNVHALAAGMLQLAQNPTLAKRMGEAARRKAIEKFDISTTARRYEELYLELYNKRMRS